ncbi:hypothetical protein Nos7524_3413 [Nostoc sp. PCC 7524]|uniref:hypothetical protein n=1 Tax=Nostoc sp. (strain ATCC 29411 / PCC 7524) TaxID=28072 RepID=UPI00029ED681|nr:hypothetical protein [Nostoc sp. PCC 7524]AFY49206.1 hypothetical protein Nos7524_3413 [Nostoc sp. PCC 7524]
MKNKQLQTKQQPTEKLSLDELNQISAGAVSGRPRPDDLVTPTIPEWRGAY